MNDAKLKTKTKQQIFYIEARHTVIRPDGQATQLEMRAIEFSALPPPPPFLRFTSGAGKIASRVSSGFFISSSFHSPSLSLSFLPPPSSFGQPTAPRRRPEGGYTRLCYTTRTSPDLSYLLSVSCVLYI